MMQLLVCVHQVVNIKIKYIFISVYPDILIARSLSLLKYLKNYNNDNEKQCTSF